MTTTSPVLLRTVGTGVGDPQDVPTPGNLEEVPGEGATTPAPVTTAPVTTAPATPEPTTSAPATATPAPGAGVPTPAATPPAPEPTSEPAPTTEVSTAPTPTATPTTSSVVEVPAFPSRPAVVESDVPWAAVAAAGLVLVVAAAGLWWWWRRTVAARGAGTAASGPAGAVASSAPDVTDDLDATLVLPPVGPGGADGAPADATAMSARAEATVQLLVRLGEAMVDAGAPIVQVNSTLQRVATVNGLPDAAVVTFPTALIVSVPQHDTVQTAVSTAGSRALRLDQVSDVLELADTASRAEVRPREALERLRAVVTSDPATSDARRAAGYVAVAAGLSMVLGGGWLDVLVAAVLGGAVAVLTALTQRVPAVFQGLVVAVCAFVVAVPVLLLVRTGWPVGLLAPLVAPLVTFLPGALLTTGVIDLATRQMIAGSSRLAAGVMQLVLLALGITAAAGLVGIPAADVGRTADGHPLGWVGPWVGVLVYAVGVVTNNEAHRGSVPWITLVLVVAYAGQLVGGVLFGAVVSSFVGALAMTPVAMLAAARRGGPPFLVTFLPGFWLLVPGALGLVGVTSALGRSTDQAITTIVTTGVSMVAISLGVLAGLALGAGLQRRVAPDGPRIV